MKKIISFGSLSLLLFSFLLFPSHAKTPQEARNELAQMNITYSEDTFFEYILDGKTDLVKLFLSAGIDPNAKNKHGITALTLASSNKHPDIVTLLKKAGAKEQQLQP